MGLLVIYKYIRWFVLFGVCCCLFWGDYIDIFINIFVMCNFFLEVGERDFFIIYFERLIGFF